MNIDSIKNGYVLDHIKAGKAMEIYNILKLSELSCQVAIITNAKSKKYNKKDIIKIGELIDIDFNSIAYIDSNITINVVKNNKLVEKKKIETPKKLVNICKCNNPRCITSIERELDQIFILTDQTNGVYRCMYCESSLKEEKI